MGKAGVGLDDRPIFESLEPRLLLDGVDFGDAVDPRFPTLLINDGARHAIVEGMRLGGRIDAETDGLQSADAEGDDNDGNDDEDGVTFTSLISPGRTAAVDVFASAPGYLNAWIDFNGLGSWNTAGDQIFTSKALVAGVNSLDFPVPAGAAVDTDVFARFRFASEGTLSFDGPASDGEVEDYLVRIEHSWDFGDAPSTFPTRLAQDGARHIIVDGVYLGSGVDREDNGQPTTAADGDDNDGNDDEDGITFLTPAVPGEWFEFEMVASAPGMVHIWFDFNGDGYWDDVGESMGFSVGGDGDGSTWAGFSPWPTDGAVGDIHARFRYTTDFALSLNPHGEAPDGEVEDYVIKVVEPLDYGDAPAPFPTLLDDDGARHVVVPGFSLSTSISDPDPDEELDGRPSASATGDDTQDRDDEDGVTWSSGLVTWFPTPGQQTPVWVTARIPGGTEGYLDAWIDFNNDGDWDDTGERIFNAEVLAYGVNDLSISTPQSAAQGQMVAARFRLSSTEGLDYWGRADDGEVEDYMVRIAELDFGDAQGAGFPTTWAQDGARHEILPNFRLGSGIDGDAEGQPTPDADGDDDDGSDDEDGVTFFEDFVAGRTPNVRFDITGKPLNEDICLDGWIDFNNNGDWNNADEHVVAEVLPSDGQHDLTVSVPATAFIGRVAARFRLHSGDVTGPGGYAVTGEVEDYLVEIFEPSAVPGAPDLWAEYDKGVSDTDNITRENTNLTFDVTGTTPGARVILYVDGDEAAAEPATGSTTTLVVNETLLDGTYDVTATQVEPGKAESLPSAPLMVTVDTVGPSITIWTPLNVFNLRTDTLEMATVTFDEAIDNAAGGASFDATDVVINSPTAVVPVTSIFDLSPTQYQINFAARTEEGQYDVTVGPAILDIAGNPMAAEHYWTFCAAKADTIFAEDYFVGPDQAFDGGDVVICGAVVTMDDIHTFKSLHIGNGGTLTVSGWAADVLDITIDTDMYVSADSVIDLAGLGYLGADGPGVGGGHSGWSSGSGGGAHGGDGGNSVSFLGGEAYGLVQTPMDMGSGGGVFAGGVGGSGGGRIHLNVLGTLTLDGSLTADGADGPAWYGGGGAGGSVWLDVGVLDGAGTMSADGGNGHASSRRNAGGGAGGRIAVHYDDMSSFDLSGTFSAAGGWGQQYGGAGTVYLHDRALPDGVLRMDNAGNYGAHTPVLANYLLEDVALGDGVRWEIPDPLIVTLHAPQLDLQNNSQVLLAGALTSDTALDGDFDAIELTQMIELQLQGTAAPRTPLVEIADSAVLRANDTSLIVAGQMDVQALGTLVANCPQSFSTLHVYTDGRVTHDVGIGGVDITAVTIQVDAGGAITALGKGYVEGTGPGAGAGSTSSSNGHGGGAYGGDGGDGNSPTWGAGGAAYGDVYNPSDYGSGGGYISGHYAGTGGGLIRLTADTLRVDGLVTADGSDRTGYYGAGGAGGGIRLDVDVLSGGGAITADGGDSGTYSGRTGGGGGGGRIALYVTDDQFGGAVSAAGGWGYEYGGAGTIYTHTATGGLLRVDNAGNAGAHTPAVTDDTFDDVDIRNSARYEVPAGRFVTLHTPNLTLTGAGQLFVAGALVSGGTSGVDFDEVYVSQQAVLTVLGYAAFFDVGYIEVADWATVRLTDNAQLVAGDVHVLADGTLVVNAPMQVNGLTVAADGLVTHDGGADAFYLYVDGDATVETGGEILVDGMGFGPMTGPGAGEGNVSTGAGAGGAGYGGYGGDGSYFGGGRPYGDAMSPTDLGSGGGSAGGSGGSGGGYIHLEVTGRLTLDGILSADGTGGTGYGGGGGSGGSIQLHVDTLSGAGSIGADGGDGAAGYGHIGGGGAGGRIALYVDTYDGFDARNVTVDGGYGYNYGERGTIYPNMIFGTKFDDANGNGVQDGGEPGLAEWTIYVDENNSGGWDTGEQMAVTDPAGEYVLTGLTTGSHTIAEIPQAGWQQTYPDSGIPVTERVNVASGGTEADGMTLDASMSADGRFVAFISAATNLVPDDTNGTTDIFVRDRWTETTTRVSVASDGTECNYGAFGPDISADGRYVTFVSEATDLVAGDTNAVADIFVHDRHTGATTRVSVAGDGTEADDESYFGVSISANGRYVAFSSAATNLVAGDTNDIGDVFVHDCWTGGTERISVSTAADEGDSLSTEPSISADGRHVAFQSHAGNLVGGDTNGVQDIFVHDRILGATGRVSVDGFGTQGNNTSTTPSISAGGQYVAFVSYASNLVDGDGNGEVDVFVHNRTTAATERVSVGSGGTEGNGASDNRSISADGRYVTFESEAANLVADDTNGMHDVFVHDRQTGMTRRVSIAYDGSEGLGASGQAAISTDGRHVAFAANSPNLVPDDDKGQWDIFASANAAAWVTGTHSVYAAPHLLVDGVDFGNIRVNQPPVADANGPYDINLGDDLLLDGSASCEPDEPFGDSIASYEWDLNNDGDFTDAAGETPTVAWTTLESFGLGVDTHPVGLRVTDTFGMTATDTAVLKIYDNRPFAAFMATPNPAAPAQTITFDGAGSSHGRPDRLIVLYEWDFEGDGIYDATGQVVTHSYGLFDSYTAVLRVTDDNIPAKTATVSDTILVNQGNQPPVADAGGPYDINLGDDLLLDGSGSYDPDLIFGDIIVYEWNLGVEGVTPTVPWATLDQMGLGVGTHPVELRVIDTFGNEATSTTVLSIYDNRPIPAFTMVPPNPVMPDFSITFDAGGSTHGRPDRSIVLYEWDFDYDGSTFEVDATGVAPTHSYGLLGNYTVALRVTDDNVPAKTATTSDIAIVEGLRDPVADAGGPYTLFSGADLALDGSGSYDPDGGDSIVSYEWDVDDDGQYDDATGAAPTVLWATLELMGLGVDTHIIKLRVRDTLDQSDIEATTLTILAAPAPTVIAFDINDSLPQRSRINSLALTFDQDVSASLDPADLSIENTTTSETFSLAGVPLAYDAGTDKATWDTSSLFLTDGNYTARLSASGVENPGGTQMAADYTFPFHVLMCDIDGNRNVGGIDCGMFVSQFGLRGNGLVADFNNDGRAGLTDFAILRNNLGNTLPAPAPAAVLQAVVEPIAAAAAPVVPSVSQPLGDNNDASGDVIATVASAPAVDLLAESPSAGGYISGAQAISGSRPATTLYRAATAEYNLRPLGDDLATGGEGDLWADILAESSLNGSYWHQLTANGERL